MTKRIIVAFGFAVFAAVVASAQPLRYNTATETTISGPIRYVVSAADADGVVGVHLEVTTPTGLVRVALAPALFIAANNYYFFTDEQVYVVGSKVGPNGEIWARAISKDGKSFLTLRDPDGTARWPRATEDDPDGCGVSHAPIR
jgi:hypothetical protein